ncbi:MAG: deoxyribose-phosphate aldolase [Candidatus Krumholzibacteriota bacterium]|nr:deoxyribose-phosphate aldolase [Candidatus Krumholzibacteriota bacterium]
MTKTALNRMIDHTLLKPEAVERDIVRICDEAKEHDFFSVCVNTHWVPVVSRELAGTRIAVCSIAGFPLGAASSAAKACEAERAVADGAREIDMVMNVGELKAGRNTVVRKDIAGVVAVCGDEALVKVIIEAALLEDEEKRRACALAVEAGAAFVKSSTGFGPPGATVEDIRLMRGAVGPDVGVKASAGIRTAAFALELVEAGANRIGTSAGVAIMDQYRVM